MAKKRIRNAETPDLTPLIDVVFLLLIFFMVSSVFKTDELALLLKLPKVEKGISQSAKETEKPISIEVNADTLAFNGKKLSIAEVENEIKVIVKKETPIELRIDKNVKYDRVMKVLSKLKKYELTNLSLITDN